MADKTAQLKEKTISGAKWNFLKQASKTAITLLYGITMARLLSPEDFGLLGMLIIFSNFALVLANSGFGSSLVQYKRSNPVLTSSVFWANLLIGLSLAFLFSASAGLISSFYNESRLELLIYALSFHLLFVSLNVVQKSLLERALNFRGIFFGETLSLVISAGVSIGMAVSGAGYWSLIVQIITNSLLTLLFFRIIGKWKPSLSFSRRRLAILYRYSLNLLGAQTLNYWVRNLDNLLIARFIGSAGLGIYSMAYRLLMFPLQNISSVMGRVFFSSYAKITDDKTRIKQMHIRLLRGVSLVSFPIMALLGGGVENFVLGFLGEKWSGLIELLYLFIPISFLQSINRMNGIIYLALGKTDIQFKVGLVVNTLVVTAFITGLQWGIFGVAAAYALATVVSFYPVFYFANRLIGLKLSELLFQIKETLLGAILAALASHLTGIWLEQTLERVFIFLIQSAAGASVFALSAYLLQKDEILNLIKLVLQRSSGKGQPESSLPQSVQTKEQP